MTPTDRTVLILIKKSFTLMTFFADISRLQKSGPIFPYNAEAPCREPARGFEI
jgi:hypothetical protein